MESLTRVEVVRIGDDEVAAVRGPDGQGYAVVRRMCEVMGLDYASQFTKLKNSAWATVVQCPTVAEDGKTRELFCLHVKSVAMWLAGIDAGRVAESVRPKIEKFQKEAADALYRWAMGGTPQTLEQMTLTVIAAYQDKVAEQQRQLVEAQPKVESFDALMSAEGTYSFRDAGKLLGVGGNHLAWWCEDQGYVFRNARRTLEVHQKYADRGLFKWITGTHQAGDETYKHGQTRITGEGLEWLRQKLKTDNVLTLIPTHEETP
jgi:phage antirepressor YoqD-like protein